MRLGFVGVGKWAQKLAAAFRACGAEIVCHDRQAPVLAKVDGMVVERIDGFGYRVPWREQLGYMNLDAIIAVAPPEITTEVALACAAAGKAVMATKPLLDHPETIRAPFYVDFWRLWSGAHQDPRALSIELSGPGPYRGFPGAFDYGPHVLAAVLDKYPAPVVTYAKVKHDAQGGERYRVDLTCGQEVVAVGFGNGAENSGRQLWGWREGATYLGGEEKSAVLQRFCQSFLDDVSEGFVDTRLLNLSRDGMRELRKIREMAKPSG